MHKAVGKIEKNPPRNGTEMVQDDMKDPEALYHTVCFSSTRTLLATDKGEQGQTRSLCLAGQGTLLDYDCNQKAANATVAVLRSHCCCLEPKEPKEPKEPRHKAAKGDTDANTASYSCIKSFRVVLFAE